MMNVDFKIGFPIDREKFNNLMNSEVYKDKIIASLYEPTANANVNVKFYCTKPTELRHTCVIYGNVKTETQVKSSLYKKNKKKAEKTTTLIVFASSEVILTGRYSKRSQEVYDFLMNVVLKNRDQIEEKTTF